MPSTVAIIMSMLLASAYIEENELTMKGNSPKAVLVAVVLKEVWRASETLPWRVIIV